MIKLIIKYYIKRFQTFIRMYKVLMIVIFRNRKVQIGVKIGGPWRVTYVDESVVYQIWYQIWLGNMILNLKIKFDTKLDTKFDSKFFTKFYTNLVLWIWRWIYRWTWRWIWKGVRRHSDDKLTYTLNFVKRKFRRLW